MNGAKKQTDYHPNEGEHGGEDVVEDSLLDGHPGLEEHREVSDLVGQLVTQNGEGCREAAHVAISEGGAYRQPIRQVVDSIAKDDHPGDTGDVLWSGVGVAVGVTVAVVQHLVLGDDHRVPVPALHGPVLHDGAAGVAALHHQVLLGVQVAGAVAAVLVLADRLPYRLVGDLVTLPDNLELPVVMVLFSHLT